MEIILDPRIKYNYSSWYILGLRHLFGKSHIIFDVQPFITLPYTNTKELNAGMAFIIKDKGKEQKVFVNFEDNADIFEDRYEWCDVYGKVNVRKEDIESHPKMVVLGPACGLQIDSKLSAITLCIQNYLKGGKYTNIHFKTMLRDYVYTFVRRRPIERYEEKVNVRPNYVFHASTLWYSKGTMATTNEYRGVFMRACQKANVDLEGGFFYLEGQAVLDEAPDYPKYKELYGDLIYTQRLSMDDYIQKTKESFVAFNTPSVCDCHGWKLGEYLCMGKAIISMPLTREMPGEGLVHGENVHFVNSPEEIYDAVLQIKNNKAYREKLERGARSYYEKWIAPDVVIKRLIVS